MSELDDTYGCLFLVVVLTTALWAVSCIQLWFYVEKYIGTDKLWLKVYVVLLWVLNTVYLILALKYLYIYFVTEFGNRDFFNNLPRDIFNSAPFSPVIAAMVQVFFIMRAWNLSNGSYVVTGGLAFLALAQFVIAMLYIAKMQHFKRLDQLVSIINYERAMNVIMFVTDISIALVLMYLLWNRRSRFRKTDNLIKHLVAFSIGTGFVVGIMMILAFIFSMVRPQSLIYVTLDYCMAKLHYNCMLASLNARSGLRGRIQNATNGMSFHLDDLGGDGISQDSRSRTIAVSTSSGSHEESNRKVIECKVDVDITSEDGVRKHRRNGTEFTHEETTDKVNSIV